MKYWKKRFKQEVGRHASTAARLREANRKILIHESREEHNWTYSGFDMPAVGEGLFTDAVTVIETEGLRLDVACQQGVEKPTWQFMLNDRLHAPLLPSLEEAMKAGLDAALHLAGEQSAALERACAEIDLVDPETAAAETEDDLSSEELEVILRFWVSCVQQASSMVLGWIPAKKGLKQGLSGPSALASDRDMRKIEVDKIFRLARQIRNEAAPEEPRIRVKREDEP